MLSETFTARKIFPQKICEAKYSMEVFIYSLENYHGLKNYFMPERIISLTFPRCLLFPCLVYHIFLLHLFSPPDSIKTVKILHTKLLFG